MRKSFVLCIIVIAVFLASMAAKDRSFNTKDVAPEIKGAGGHVEMQVDLNENGSIKDVKILHHNETPEYAGGITKPDFLNQFKGKNVNDPFVIGEDIDAVTGATISSKAVADTLKTCLERISGKAETRSRLFDRLKDAGLEPREARYYKGIE